MPFDTFYRLKKDKQMRIIDAIIDEMALHSYEHITISNIVRQANIPRGSFYQYFSGTADLFEFMYHYIAKLKMTYMEPLLSRNEDSPFLDRFLELYMLGIQFAKDHPRLMAVGQKMVVSDYYKTNDYIRKGNDMAISLFQSMIESDQKKGTIRPEIDPTLLAKMLLETLTRLSIDYVDQNNGLFNNLEKAVRQMVDILKKGIEPHV